MEQQLLETLDRAYPGSSRDGLAKRIAFLAAAAREQGLPEAVVTQQIESWLIQFPRRREDWVSADSALADLERLLIGAQAGVAAVWRGLRRVAGVAFSHYVPVAGSAAAVAGAFYGLAYARFYDALGITPEQAGFTPTQILAHSVIGGLVLLALLTFAVFCFFVPLIPLRDKESARAEPGRWSQVLVNALFTAAAIASLLVLGKMADFPFAGSALLAGFCALYFLASFDFGWSGWHPTIGPGSLEIAAERYAVVAVVCALPALAFTGAITFLEADNLGDRASVGQVVEDPTIGIFPFLGVRAEPALITWTAAKADQLPRCALYLGTSGGSLILYDHRSSSTFDIPAADVAFELQSEASSCEAPRSKVAPSVIDAPDETVRCRHGKWHSSEVPQYKYYWIVEDESVPYQHVASPWLLDVSTLEPETVINCRIIASTPLGHSSALSSPLVLAGDGG